MNPNDSGRARAVNTSDDSGADLSGGASPARDIGNDGRPRSVGARNAEQIVANAEAEANRVVRQDDADANDTAEDILRAFIEAAHDAPAGAAFSGPVRRANKFLGAHHRVIPEAAPLDPTLAARVEEDTAREALIKENALNAATGLTGEQRETLTRTGEERARKLQEDAAANPTGAPGLDSAGMTAADRAGIVGAATSNPTPESEAIRRAQVHSDQNIDSPGGLPTAAVPAGGDGVDSGERRQEPSGVRDGVDPLRDVAADDRPSL